MVWHFVSYQIIRVVMGYTGLKRVKTKRMKDFTKSFIETPKYECIQPINFFHKHLF